MNAKHFINIFFYQLQKVQFDILIYVLKNVYFIFSNHIFLYEHCFQELNTFIYVSLTIQKYYKLHIKSFM